MAVDTARKRNWLVRFWRKLFGRRVEYVYIEKAIPMETVEPPAPASPVANLWLFLESRDAGFHFEANVFVDFRIDGANGTVLTSDPLRLAKLAVQERARAVASRLSMGQYDQFRGRLHSALLNEVRVDATEVVAWAQVLTIRVNDEDARLFTQREQRAAGAPRSIDPVAPRGA